ncbi:transposase [Archangium sp.]|uniref:transposase n=1 Tax=Archangium sp. TaxID=1872627 RepID=UPI0039C89C7A
MEGNAMGWLPRRLTAEQLEERRREAVRLLRGGHHSQAEVARRLGVSEAAVSHWARQLREGGSVRALRRRLRPGRPPYLEPSQWRQLARRSWYVPFCCETGRRLKKGCAQRAGGRLY